MKRYFRTLFFLLLTVWAGASAQAVNAADAHRRNPIIVAVIDGGFDLTHPYLQPYLWYNENERPADGIDHDGNGLVNDYRGWNFLGNSEGTSFSRAGTCEYRAWKGLRLRKLAGEQLTEAEEHLSDSLARRMHLDLYVLQAEDAIQKKKEGWELEQQHLEQLNKDDDAHRAIGNNPDDVCNLTYGNNTLNYNDEDSYHGTMVTGLVAQVAKQLDADIRILHGFQQSSDGGIQRRHESQSIGHDPDRTLRERLPRNPDKFGGFRIQQRLPAHQPDMPYV